MAPDCLYVIVGAGDTHWVVAHSMTDAIKKWKDAFSRDYEPESVTMCGCEVVASGVFG